jgi:hypothetical protein
MPTTTEVPKLGDRLLTPAEVSGVLRVSVRQVLRLKGLRRLRVGTRRGIRYREADLRAWIDAQVRRGG